MEFIKKVKPNAVVRLLKVFPNVHLIALGILTLGLASVILFPSSGDSAPTKISQIIAIPSIESLPEEAETPLPLADAASLPTSPEIQYEEFSQDKPASLKIKSGDSLSILFKRAGLNNSAMLNFLQSNAETKQLQKLMPGQMIEFYIDEDNQLSALVLKKNKLSNLEYRRTGDSFSYEEITQIPDVRLAFRSATIEHSLYTAGAQVQLDDSLIMGLAGIFGWDIDFALDIRKGDQFKILFEEKFLNGEKIGNGEILAAEFINQGHPFQAVRYADTDKNVSYFTPTGESMQKAFLRAPLDFRRISSNFNPARLHPISRTVRPHRGTDYAASRGTPVWASGSGRVIASSYTKANGNYVIIQHGNNIQTKYLHLHKRLVKKGARVKQKQKIGTVGSTGYSTAPHLHYEFLLDGVHRNPRTIVQKLPKAKAIASHEFHHFLNQTQPLMATLEAESTKYASVETTDQIKAL